VRDKRLRVFYAVEIMKYAILGDIHANLPALEAVLDHAASQGVTDYISLGDVVGYNADPSACIQIVRQLCCAVVKGNHDHYAATDEPMNNFNEAAEETVAWTRSVLNAEERAWLGGLPLKREMDNFIITHSSMDHPEKWNYVLDRAAAAESLRFQDAHLCFIGHTHVPVVFQQKQNEIKFFRYERMHLQPGIRYLVNTGSVGQPRDNDSRASYAVYDLLENSITLHRVKYDIAKAQQRNRAAGLPEKNAARLARGQ